MPMSRRWSDAEVGRLKAEYDPRKLAELAATLGRTADSVRLKAREVGIQVYRSPRWTEDHLRALRESYPVGGWQAVARLTGRGRGSIQSKADELGIRFRALRLWSVREEEQLRLMMGVGMDAAIPDRPTIAEIARGFRRTRTSVYRKLVAMGLDYRVGRPWCPENVRILRDAYPEGGTKEVATILGCSRESVRSKAKALGLRCTVDQRWRSGAPRPETRGLEPPMGEATVRDRVARLRAGQSLD